MDSNFEAALRAVLKHEGGYVDHPKDPGGATNKGITLATFRRMVMPKGTKADLKKLTVEQASIAYRKGYWAAIAGSLLPLGIDYALFDFGVNSGPARAVRELQKIIGATVDGVVGPETLKAVQSSNTAELIEALCARRLEYVRSLKNWPTFGKGWSSRIAGVRKLALEMAVAREGGVVVIGGGGVGPHPSEPGSPATDAPAGFRPDWAKIGLWLAALLGAGWALRNLFT